MKGVSPILRPILLALLVLSICFMIFSQSYWIWFLNQARRRGLYPDPGKATLFDVKRLITKGEMLLAISVYQEIFGVSFKEAKKAVEDLEKNLKT